MSHIQNLRRAVQGLYEQKDPNRDDWADWLYENHVLWVAKKSRELAEKYAVNADIAEAAALIHDVADAVMARRDDNHESESLRLARELLVECGYHEAEIKIIVDDAARFHSCHDGHKPNSQEGLVLATADAMAHFQTSFYAYALWMRGRHDYDSLRAWALAKLERDYHDKIMYEDERAEVRSCL